MTKRTCGECENYDHGYCKPPFPFWYKHYDSPVCLWVGPRCDATHCETFTQKIKGEE